MCDRVAQDEQIGLACLVAPAPFNYQSIWAWKQELEKGGELKEGRGCGGTVWCCRAPGRALVLGQPAQTDSLSSPSTNTGSLVQADSFRIADSTYLCVG